MPLPIIGAGLGMLAKRVLPAAGRLAGRALRAATKGKLLGQGGGRELVRTAARGALGGVTAGGLALTARDIVRTARRGAAAGTAGAPYEYDPVTGEQVRTTKLYRRMNYTNPRALNRAIRRLGGAEKVFKKIFSFNHGTAATRVRPKFRRKRS